MPDKLGETPSWYERFHWVLFNILAKLFGGAAFIVSMVFIIPVITGALGFREGDEYPVVVLIIFIPLAVVGFLIIRVKPYVPQKYRERYEQRNR